MLNLKGLVGLVSLTSLHATKLRWGIDAPVAGMNLEGGMAGEAILLGDSSRTRTLPEYDSDYSVRVEFDQFGQHSGNPDSHHIQPLPHSDRNIASVLARCLWQGSFYKVIAPHEDTFYSARLAPRRMLHERAYRGEGSLDLLRRMKPFWNRDLRHACFD